MIENNAYVDNERLLELMKELPLTQKIMKELQLQSHFSLPRRSGFIVWRLHEDIPYRMPGPDHQPAAKKPRVEEQEEEEKPPEEALVEVDPGEGPSGVVLHRIHFLAASRTIRWSAKELSLIDLMPNRPYKDAYREYLASCERERSGLGLGLGKGS